ncbi:MAG: dTMP kinase [Casimicrobium sp.]
MQGKFITFEGIDGAGKSSHIDAVRDNLVARGIEVVCTREPGGTPLGESIRSLFLNHAMTPQTEALLVFAARNEHLRQVVWPTLARGAWVLCDRFTDATFAYQGGGRQLGNDYVASIANIVHPGFSPALTLLFDLPPDAAQDRIAGRDALDRIESEAKDFHDRVRQTYLDRAKNEAHRIAVFDSRQAKEIVREQVLARVERLFSEAAST